MDYLFHTLVPKTSLINLLSWAYSFQSFKSGKGETTDRDNFKYKVELTESLIYNLFNEYLKLQNDTIAKALDENIYYYNVQSILLILNH